MKARMSSQVWFIGKKTLLLTPQKTKNKKQTKETGKMKSVSFKEEKKILHERSNSLVNIIGSKVTVLSQFAQEHQQKTMEKRQGNSVFHLQNPGL